ncbi:MAG: hypothetical protein MJA29_09065, partial [Candidatus Omnitrophica bacterium]|nr:hypothetical protein [Candidatus Omnitrophota bacterium]
FPVLKPYAQKSTEISKPTGRGLLKQDTRPLTFAQIPEYLLDHKRFVYNSEYIMRGVQTEDTLCTKCRRK